MKAFISALTFLTRLPFPSSIQISKWDWEKSPFYYPVVGVILGIILYWFATGVGLVVPNTVAAVIILIGWIWLTGGLHLDGWMDVADAIGSSRTREEMLEIMKDSRVGAMGVLAAILLLFLKVVLVFELLNGMELASLFFAPFLARFILLLTMYLWPYGKRDGIGSGLKNELTLWKVLVQAVLAIMLLVYFLEINGFIIFTGTIVASLLFTTYLFKKFRAITGDCYGALVEFTEVVVLLLCLILM